MIFNRRDLSRIAGLVPCCFAICVMLAVNTGCAVKSQKEVGLPLVKNGKPVATIVIGKEASRAAQFAAAELQYHIEKITGVRLAIVDDAEAVKGPHILVGESAATRKPGLHNKDFKHQEYLIRFLPDTLILMGRDDNDDKGKVDYADEKTFPGRGIEATFGPDRTEDQATCYAVYDFLEHFCGVRWYLPTDLGMVCPEEKTLSVKGADMRRAPAMKYRAINRAAYISINLDDKGEPVLPLRERILFQHRQRLTGIQPYACSHAFYSYYKRYLKDHPEWFAKGYDADMPAELRNTPADKRTVDTTWRGYPALYYPNMCYTDAGFISNVVNRARSFFGTGVKAPGEEAAGDYFALGPMDSTGKDKFCKCPACQALLHKEPPCNKWRKQSFFFDDLASDYIFGFMNKVAREVGKTHPDKYLTQIAYHQNYYPPTAEPLEPNIAVSFCIHAQLRPVPAMDRAVTDLLNKWDEAAPGNPKYLWLYFHRPGRAGEAFPGFMAHNMVKQMKDYHRRGIRGVFAEPTYLPKSERGPGEKYSSRAPNASLLEMYLAYKLAYDETLDGDKLIDEFFTLFYGAAARPMQNLYEAIERVYCDPANYAFNPDRYFGYQTADIAWGKLGTAERMAEFGELMEAAKTAAQTEMEKKRVALFEKNIWNRMQAGRKEYGEQKARQKSVQLTGIPRLTGAATNGSLAKAGMTQTPQSTTQDAQGYTKSARAARIIGAAPGGDPNAVDWAQTPQSAILGNWGTLDGKPTGRRLEGRLLHDGSYLYVQLQEIMDTSKLVIHGDDNIWNEDRWEFFVRGEQGKGCRQIGVNAKGAHKELTCGDDGKKESEWQSGVRVVSVGNPDCWMVRMAFPLKNLLPSGVAPGQTIYANIFRSSGDNMENLSWNPTFTDAFYAPSQMGSVKLADKTGLNTEERTEGE